MATSPGDGVDVGAVVGSGVEVTVVVPVPASPAVLLAEGVSVTVGDLAASAV